MRLFLLLTTLWWYMIGSIGLAAEPRTLTYRDVMIGDRHFLGTLDSKDADRTQLWPVFAPISGSRDWHIQPKGDKWLIGTTATVPGEKRFFLSAIKKTGPHGESLIVRENADETCLWEIEFEGNVKNPANHSDLFGRVKATVGDFRGHFLALGEPFTLMAEGVEKQYTSVMLRREKSEITRIRFKLDGK